MRAPLRHASSSAPAPRPHGSRAAATPRKGTSLWSNCTAHFGHLPANPTANDLPHTMLNTPFSLLCRHPEFFEDRAGSSGSSGGGGGGRAGGSGSGFGGSGDGGGGGARGRRAPVDDGRTALPAHVREHQARMAARRSAHQSRRGQHSRPEPRYN